MKIRPKINPPVFVVINSILQEGRWNELCLSHAAGPRSDHLFLCGIALFENAQGRQKLIDAELGATRAVGKRCCRIEYADIAHDRSERALHTPNRRDDFTRHAVSGIHLGKQRLVHRDQLPAFLDSVVGGGSVHIHPDLPFKFWLVIVGLPDFWFQFDAGHGHIKRVCRDPLGECVNAEG